MLNKVSQAQRVKFHLTTLGGIQKVDLIEVERRIDTSRENLK
jgi:hypothetical protein